MLPTPELEIARNLPAQGCTTEEAQRYTRWLATHHYENFNVVSWLLPRHLHQHFYNVYAYCRWSDDLGDEVSDRARALELLDAWEDELRLIYQAGRAPSHPVLIALARDDSREGHSGRAVQRFAARVSAGPGRASLRHLGRRARLLRVFGESRRAAGAVSLRLSRSGAAAAFGFHVHGAAAGEFLAGCFARPRKGPDLHSAGRSRSARFDRGRHRRAPI